MSGPLFTSNYRDWCDIYSESGRHTIIKYIVEDAIVLSEIRQW